MIERSEDSIPSDAVASRCSQGGEEPMAIAARSHDRARDQERREFWKACFVHLLLYDNYIVETCAQEADKSLEEFEKRFGATADANLRATRGHGEG
jgi:hypothetical protein